MSYETVKALHIIAVISWMAGLLYLPRLFVYHTQAAPGGESDTMLQTMERKLLRYIMNPAMIASFIFGLWMLALNDALLKQGWFHMKFLLVFFMAGAHGMMAAHRKRFAAGTNSKSDRYFRIFNEVPTVLMIIIVLLAVRKTVF